MKLLFKRYQPEILAFVNTDWGKEWLADSFGQKIYRNDKIIKVTTNGFHLLKDFVNDRPIIQSTFYPSDVYIKKLAGSLEALRIAEEGRFLRQIQRNIYSKPSYFLQHPFVYFTDNTYNPGTGAADGTVQNQGSAVDWATKRTSNGDTAYAPSNYVEFKRSGSTTNWIVLGRVRTSFDTSSLTSSASISAAIMSYYGGAKGNPDGNSPTYNVYTSSPADPATLAASDFQNIGSTAQCDTAIAYASWTASAYNDYTFNATGRGNINKTGVSNFGQREVVYDVGGSTPTMSSPDADTYVQSNSSASASNKPKLVVTFTLPAAGSSAFRNLLGVGV